jgi:hypothetical protein
VERIRALWKAFWIALGQTSQWKQMEKAALAAAFSTFKGEARDQPPIRR